MTIHDPNPLSPGLEMHVRALAGDAPDAHAVEAAQIRLGRRLADPASDPTPTRRPRTGWYAFAATACAALALILVPFIVSERGGLAFAEVQRHFENFRTLAMTIEQGSGDFPMPKINVVLDDTGSVRTDVGTDISVVVNVKEGQVLMLMHDARNALRFPIGVTDMMPAKEALSWIDELKHFKGIAKALTETREIDGVTAHGWSLDIANAQIQLWARDDGLPLAMSVGEGVGIDLRFRFNFDAPIDTGQFSTEIPAGYTTGFGG
jgi:hypothetical protein